MASELPIGIEFELPAQWRAAPPDAVGAPEAAFVALRPEPVGDFVANITVSGELDASGKPLSAFADEALSRLQRSAPDAQLRKRVDAGSEGAPGLTQVATMSTDVRGVQHELVQIHVFLAMPDAEEPARQAVIELVLTSGREDFDEVAPDFTAFVGSVAPHAHNAATTP